MLLPLPKSRAEIEKIQRQRKLVAFENAKRAPFYRGRLDGIDPGKLDSPQEWRKIPILTKDELRTMPVQEFQDRFCVAPQEEIAEFWRSGGTTGVPLFYPRTFTDISYALLSFARTFQCVGCGKGDTAHLSFPLGIHPVGQMWARSAFDVEIGMSWIGSGAATPSLLQLELIQRLKPTIWMGMSSYGLHLANLADVHGIDLAASSVQKILCCAEPLSTAKREKLQRMWGAQVYDTFGMTEAGMMGAEGETLDGFHIWTDMYFIEMLDPETGEPVPQGQTGTLIVTPLWTNNATPFLRWNSGDLVTHEENAPGSDRFSVFPRIKHTHRTTGFFKVRGVNINHAEFEDFMFRNPRLNDFKAEIVSASGLDVLKLSIEVKTGADAAVVKQQVADDTKSVFEVTPEVVVLESGTLAKEFESSVKAPRFSDKRS